MIKPLAKIVLIPLELTAAADAGIHKKILGSGHHHSPPSALHNATILIISNDKIEDIIKM